MRWCDSCPQHETWQLAITFEFTFVASEWLASFQSGTTYPTRRAKSLETSPQCLWITGSKITARAPILTECHENSDLETSDPFGVSKTETLLCYLIFAISSMARLGLFLFQQPRKQNFRTLLYAKWNEVVTKFCRNVLRDSCHGTVTGVNVRHLYKCHVTVLSGNSLQ